MAAPNDPLTDFTNSALTFSNSARDFSVKLAALHSQPSSLAPALQQLQQQLTAQGAALQQQLTAQGSALQQQLTAQGAALQQQLMALQQQLAVSDARHSNSSKRQLNEVRLQAYKVCNCAFCRWRWSASWLASCSSGIPGGGSSLRSAKRRCVVVHIVLCE